MSFRVSASFVAVCDCLAVEASKNKELFFQRRDLIFLTEDIVFLKEDQKVFLKENIINAK